jgi:hypothetical protein
MHLFQVRSRPPAPAFHWKASQVVRDRGRTPAGGVPPCTPTTSPMPVRRMDHVLPEMDLLCTPGFKELQEFNNCSLPEAVNGEADHLTWLSRRQIEVASRWTVHADPTPNRPRCWGPSAHSRLVVPRRPPAYWRRWRTDHTDVLASLARGPVAHASVTGSTSRIDIKSAA